MNNLQFNRRAKWVWQQVNPNRINRALCQTQRDLMAKDEQISDLFYFGVQVVLFVLCFYSGSYVLAVFSASSAVLLYALAYYDQLKQRQQIQNDIDLLHQKKRWGLRFKTMWLIDNDHFLFDQLKYSGSHRLVSSERRGLFVWKAKNAQNKKHSQKTAKP